MEREIQREIQTMNSEKRMDELALKGYQNKMAEQLNGYLGQDMLDVLEGKKKVKLSLWKRIKNRFDGILWSLNSEQ